MLGQSAEQYFVSSFDRCEICEAELILMPAFQDHLRPLVEQELKNIGYISLIPIFTTSSSAAPTLPPQRLCPHLFYSHLPVDTSTHLLSFLAPWSTLAFSQHLTPPDLVLNLIMPVALCVYKNTAG